MNSHTQRLAVVLCSLVAFVGACKPLGTGPMHRFNLVPRCACITAR